MKFFLNPRNLIAIIVLLLATITFLLFHIWQHPADAGSNSSLDNRADIHSKIGEIPVESQMREKSKRALIEDRKAEMERLKKIGFLSDGSQRFTLFDQNNRVSTEALSFAGLGEADRTAVEQSISRLNSEMESNIFQRAVRDPSTSQSGTVKYSIPADTNFSDQIIADFRDELIQKFGISAAEKLLSGLHQDRYYGGFGMMDAKVELKQIPGPDGQMSDVLVYQFSDPETGQELRGGTKPPKAVTKLFASPLIKKMEDARNEIPSK